MATRLTKYLQEGDEAAIQTMVNRRLVRAWRMFLYYGIRQIFEDEVVALLLLKHASDVWHAHLVSQRDADSAADSAAPSSVPVLAVEDGMDFASLYAQRAQPDIGTRINAALDSLAARNQPHLAEVWRALELDFENRHSGCEAEHNANLHDLLTILGRPEMDFTPRHTSRRGCVNAHAAGTAMVHLLNHLSCNPELPPRRQPTPERVCMLMLKLLDIQPGETVYDPSASDGTLMAHCARTLRRVNDGQPFALAGEEGVRRQWGMAKVNLLLHGCAHAELARADALRAPGLLDADGRLRQFDVVLSVLPFDGDDWGHQGARKDAHRRFASALPPEDAGMFAYIQHMVACMRAETGRMAVLVPDDCFARDCGKNRVCAALVQQNLLDAVVSVSALTFYGVACNCSILILRRNRERRAPVMFIRSVRDAQPDGEEYWIGDADMARTVDAYQSRTYQEYYAQPVPLSRVAAGGCVLVADAYVRVPWDEDGGYWG